MAKKTKKSNQNYLFVGACAIVAIIVVVVIAIIIANHKNVLGDSFFVSDGNKYVLTLETGDTSFAESSNDPLKTHVVYFYSGDKITGAKTYYEYTDSTAAQSAFDYLKANYSDEDIKSFSIDGKYIIVTVPETEYQNLTASEVKEQIELMETLNNQTPEEDTQTDDTEDSAETDAEETKDLIFSKSE